MCTKENHNKGNVIRKCHWIMESWKKVCFTKISRKCNINSGIWQLWFWLSTNAMTTNILWRLCNRVWRQNDVISRCHYTTEKWRLYIEKQVNNSWNKGKSTRNWIIWIQKLQEIRTSWRESCTEEISVEKEITLQGVPYENRYNSKEFYHFT